jgi:hypothetical protein
MDAKKMSWLTDFARPYRLPKVPRIWRPQPKQQILFHRRGTEFAEIGIFLDQERLWFSREARERKKTFLHYAFLGVS